MDFNELREFIAENLEIKGALHGEEVDAIFLLEKPKEVDAENFLVYSFYEHDGGSSPVHTFEVEIKICAADVPTAISLKDSLINLLDFYNRPCEIDRFAKFVFNNEGGVYLDTNTNYYVNKLFFICKLL